MESIDVAVVSGGRSARVAIWPGMTLLELAEDMVKAGLAGNLGPEEMLQDLTSQGYVESNGSVVVIIDQT